MPCLGAEDPKTIVLDLDEAMSMMLKNHPAIKQADQSIKASSARLSQKKSGHYPSLDAEFKYAHLDPSPIVPLAGAKVQFFPTDNYDAHLGLMYNLIDFGKTRDNTGIAQHGLNFATASAGVIKTNLAFTAIQNFYSILLLQQSVLVEQQQLQTLGEHLNMAQKKLEAGTATQFDVLTIQVKVEEAKSKKIDVENSLNKQLISFKRLTGINNKAEVTLKGDFTAQPESVDEESLVSKALSDRLELVMARDYQAGAWTSLSLAKSDNYPSVNLNFLWGSKNGYFPDLDERITNTVSAATVSMPLFNGFRTCNKISEARANFKSAVSSTKDTEDAVVSEVRQAVSDFRASVERIKAAEFHVQLASEAVTQAKVRYENGVITNLDMLNAETSLSEAKLMKLQAIYSYITSKENLKKSAGGKLWKKEQ